MKKSTIGAKWLFNDKNVPYGATLGYEFCAEHEHGIKGIWNAFGVSNIKKADGWRGKWLGKKKIVFGVDARIAAMPLGGCGIMKAGLLTGFYYYTGNLESINRMIMEAKRNTVSSITGFWDEDGFLLVERDDKLVKDLYRAFIDGYGFIGSLPGIPGLSLADNRLIPGEMAFEMALVDEEKLIKLKDEKK